MSLVAVLGIGFILGTRLKAEELPSTATHGMHVSSIDEDAPAFRTETKEGTITFPVDYKGQWAIFFSPPADFTPVCTTEFMTFAAMIPEFEAPICKLLGLSIDR